jgi:hypothetical protein
MGLVYLNARYYDPAASRFVSPDPVVKPSDPRTLDAYMYGANNPASFTDASGKWACPSYLTGAALDNCNAYANGNTNYFSGKPLTYEKKSFSVITSPRAASTPEPSPSVFAPLTISDLPINPGPSRPDVPRDPKDPWTLPYNDLQDGYLTVRNNFIYSSLLGSPYFQGVLDGRGDVTGVYHFKVNNGDFSYDDLNHQLDFMDYQFENGMTGWLSDGKNVDIMANGYLEAWHSAQQGSQTYFGRWEEGMVLIAINKNVEFYLDRAAALPRQLAAPSAQEAADLLRATWRSGG